MSSSSNDTDDRLERAKSLSDSIGANDETEPRLLEWTSGETGDNAEDDEQPFMHALRDIARIATVHREAGGHTSHVPENDTSLERWGHLELIEQLGEGSTGLVYRARDTELGHEVALKLLRKRVLSTNDKGAFLDEGRRHVLVNHNNVVQIYGAGEHDERVGIWMELIEGHTLRKLCEQQGALGSSEALNIGIEVGSAVAAVHQAGLSHGDIKADNVMRERGGRIVVMDFSSSRLREESKGARDMVRGTPLYMAPELLEGKKPTQQSDVYAIGVLLYFLLTTRYPYDGANLRELRKSLKRGEPASLKDIRPDLPSELGPIVMQAIALKPDDRYRSVGALIDALTALLGQRTMATSQPGTFAGANGTLDSITAPVDASGSTATWMKLAAPALALLAGLGLYRYFSGDEIVQFTNPVQVTSMIGVEDSPTWSPDGQTLAYDAIRSGDLFGGNWDIWVTQVGRGEPINRTADYTGTDKFPSWSPDGAELAFWSSRDGGGYFVMPPLTGAPRKVAPAGQVVWPRGPSPPQWSADSNELAYVDYDNNEAFVEILSLRTGDSRRLPLPGKDGTGRLDLNWSSDGRFFAYVDAADPAVDVTRVWVLDVESGESSPVTDGHSNDWSPTWSQDARTLFIVSNRGGTRDLWRVSIDDDGLPVGTAEQMTLGLGIRRAVFSADASKLAYAKGRRVANLWRAPIDAERPATWEHAEQLTFDEALTEYVNVSADGEVVLLSSDRTGNPDIWRVHDDGRMEQLTSDPTPDWDPRLSPDGAEIAFYAYRSGNRDIWVMSVDGGRVRQVTKNSAQDWMPAWSHDGREIAFSSDRSGQWDVWVISADGGEPRQLTSHPEADWFAQFSPDDEWVVFSSERSGEWGLWRVPVDGGEAEKLSDEPGHSPRWLPDGSGIIFAGQGDRRGDLWMLSMHDRMERPVTALEGKLGNVADSAIATDGRYVYFSWEENVGDLWLMDVSGGS